MIEQDIAYLTFESRSTISRIVAKLPREQRPMVQHLANLNAKIVFGTGTKPSCFKQAENSSQITRGTLELLAPNGVCEDRNRVELDRIWRARHNDQSALRKARMKGMSN